MKLQLKSSQLIKSSNPDLISDIAFNDPLLFNVRKTSEELGTCLEEIKNLQRPLRKS
jgi:hypothetical protein